MTSRFPQDFWPDQRHAACGFPHLDDSIERRDSLEDTPSSRKWAIEAAPAGDLDCDAEAADERPAYELFVPENYEPNYAYPLIVWFHRQGGSERDLRQVMPKISARNYLGLALRGLPYIHGQETNPPAAGESPAASYWLPPEGMERGVRCAVSDLRRRFNVHSERIYVAGFADGATAALSLLLRRPEWFAGAIALGGPFPSTPNALRRFRDLRGKRVFLATGARDGRMPISELVRAGRLLHTTGIDVSTRIYDAAHHLVPAMLDDANHWLMGAVASASRA